MLSGLAAAGLGAIGSIGSAIFQNHSAKSLTNLNYAHQVEAAKNAHQWEVEDLKKAGLNPILSANNGASLSGGGISAGTPMENPVNSALNAMKTEKEAELTEATKNREEATATQIKTQNKYLPEKLRKEIAQMEATSAKYNAEKSLIEAQTNLQDAINEVQANKGYQYYKAYGEPLAHGAAQGAGFAVGTRIAGKGGFNATSARNAVSKGFKYKPSDGGTVIYRNGKPVDWVPSYNINPNRVKFHKYEHY